MAGNKPTARTPLVSSPSNKVLDSVTRLKMPFALLLLFSFGSYVFFQHRKTETQAWEELKKLKAQLVEASTMRQEVSKFEEKVASMLKDIQDFRQILVRDEKMLTDSKTTISGMNEKMTLFTKQLDSCPGEIQGSLKTLEAKIVKPESESQLLDFEQKYMPLMWKATRELRHRIESAAPEDMFSLRQQVDALHELLRDASNKIDKVDNSEFQDRQARVEELQQEIHRLGGDTQGLQPSAFASLAQKRISSAELKGAHGQKGHAKSAHKRAHVKGEPLKCLGQVGLQQ